MSWAGAGAVLMFLSVAFGAFGAHALKSKLTPEMLTIFEVGVRYQTYHALGLFVVAWFSERNFSIVLPAAGWFFVAGIILFSGSLYALSLTGTRWFGAITPIGGLCFLIGWACIAWSVLGRRA